jgi:PAS domain S-box-containing protein
MGSEATLFTSSAPACFILNLTGFPTFNVCGVSAKISEVPYIFDREDIMIAPPKPEDEAKRLAALRALKILDTPAEERYDRITRIAQKLFDVPIALVSLVDAERQWFKSRVGLDVIETPRDISFCGHAVLQSDSLVVPDATTDQRFFDNPLVTGNPKIRFYAGQPLRDVDGNKLGTLCLIDRRPRMLDDGQMQLLHDLGIWAENELNAASLSNVLHRLQESEQRYQTLALEAMEATSLKQAILDSADYSIISTYANGIIRSFNQVAQRWLGYTAEEVIDKLTPAVFHDDGEVAVRAQLLTKEIGTPIEPGFEVFVAKARFGMVDEHEWSYLRKDGSRFPVHLSVTALRDAKGKITGFLGIANDISAHKQAERERDRFFNMSLDMMCIVGFDGYIKQLNPAWKEALGFSNEELMVELFGKYLHRDDRDRFLAESEKLMQGQSITYFECRHRCKDGSYKWMLWNATAYVEEQLIYAVARDITERKRIEQMQHEFVSTVSHELRTPLTSIRGSLGLIAGGVSGEVPSKVKELIGIAHKNCERLVQLINDILDSEKIASGKMKFNLRPIEIMPLVQQAVSANQPYAAQFSVKLRITDELPEVCLLTDPDRLIQVLNNLLSNAAKFSPQGGEVLISVRRNGGNVHVSVSDQGPGILPEFQERIFQRFVQTDASDAREKGGTGLGLSIAKAIVDSLGGKIDFTTNPIHGTTFYFELQELQNFERAGAENISGA